MSFDFLGDGWSNKPGEGYSSAYVGEVQSSQKSKVSTVSKKEIERTSSVEATRSVQKEKVNKLLSKRPKRTASIDQAIVILATRAKTSDEIVTHVNSIDGVFQTSKRTVRKVRAALLEPELRKTINSKVHQRTIETHLIDVQSRRAEWMESKGMFVWSKEEALYFDRLLGDKSFFRAETKKTKRKERRQRARHYNHIALAAAMNEHFQTTKFTPKRTSDKLERFEADRRRKDKLNALPDKFRELDDTVAVAPLIIVPREDLGEVRAHDLRESAVDDAAAWVADDVA
jgi:hypothetical protein